MILTASRETDLQAAPVARAHVEIWEKSLAYRISLQQILDKFNEFPVLSSTSGPSFPTSDLKNFQNNEMKLELQSILQESSNLLAMQCPAEDDDDEEQEEGKKKRKFDHCPTWEELSDLQDTLAEDWKSVINKWHARTHFGSEKKKSSLKVFNQTIWDQVDETMRDDSRVIEKSRMPVHESKRKKLQVLEEKSSGPEEEEDGEKGYDCEVYDDRPFYSLLLKAFIANSTTTSTSSSHATMRPEDLAALKTYKKSRSKVDRKASKGRKIKYVPHEKLKNFMFPIPLYSMTSNYNFSAANDMGSVDRLYQSLFQ